MNFGKRDCLNELETTETAELDKGDGNTEYIFYKDLPRRSIIKTIQKEGDSCRKINTYGVLAKTKDNKWCLVRTRHTAAISYILHGAYQPVHFSSLLKAISRKELNLLKSIETLEDFKEVYRKIFNCECRGEYAYLRLSDLKEELYLDDIPNILKPTIEIPEDTLFTIPKGRRISEENTRDTALREFYEETGLTGANGKLSENSILVETTGFADRRYSIEIWGLSLNSEFDLNDIPYPDKREIVERKFIQFNPDEFPNATVGPFFTSNSEDKDLIDKEVLMLAKKAIKAGLFN